MGSHLSPKTSSNGDIACKSTVRRGRSGADHVVSTWNQNQLIVHKLDRCLEEPHQGLLVPLVCWMSLDTDGCMSPPISKNGSRRHSGNLNHVKSHPTTYWILVMDENPGISKMLPCTISDGA